MSAPAAVSAPLADADARAAYAALLAVSPQASPFSGLAFADATCAAYGHTGRLLLVGDDAVPEAGLVVFERRRGPLRASVLPPYAEFVTPLLRAPLDAAQVHARASPLDALSRALTVSVQQASLRLHPTIADARPLAWAGWTLTPAYVYAAPLAGDDGQEAWGRYTRKTVRRHASAYRIDEGAELTATAVQLAADSLAAKGHSHPPVGAVARLARALVEAGEARALVARPVAGGDAEAGLVVALGGETVYYWVVGSRPGPAMTVLLAHVAQTERANGATRLFLGGANVPGVAEFKRGFGGELAPTLRARWIGPRWLHAMQALRPA